jgi:hypothetical protein
VSFVQEQDEHENNTRQAQDQAFCEESEGYVSKGVKKKDQGSQYGVLVDKGNPFYLILIIMWLKAYVRDC